MELCYEESLLSVARDGCHIMASAFSYATLSFYWLAVCLQNPHVLGVRRGL